jgi:outer membrane protein assembly factor BamE
MQRIRAYGLLILGCLLLAGCGWRDFKIGLPGVYRLDIPQGNIVTQEMVDKLKPGMNKRQVRFVMGTPLIVDTFERERWDYVQSMESKGHERSQERISLFFKDDLLVSIGGDLAPSESEDAAAAPPDETASSSDKDETAGEASAAEPLPATDAPSP